MNNRRLFLNALLIAALAPGAMAADPATATVYYSPS